MEDDKSKLKISIDGFDPLGLKSAGEISKQFVQLGIDSIKVFLNLTCKPLLEELGLGAKDIGRNWRLLNTIKMLEKAKGKLSYDLDIEELAIDPRVAFQIVEQASIVSDETLQDMWAGLFAASCRTFAEDENIFFVDILKRLTSSQVKLLTYLCEKSQKHINIQNLPLSKEEGVVTASLLKIEYADISKIMETSSILKANSELTALESMALIEWTGNPSQGVPLHQRIKAQFNYNGIRPSLIALLLYVRCKGSTETPFTYFLPNIIDYYNNIFEKFMNTLDVDILNFVYENFLIGKKLDGDIEFGSHGINLKQDSWCLLSNTEITNKLRPYMIFRHMPGLENSYSVEVNKKKFGTFDFLNGFKKN